MAGGAWGLAAPGSILPEFPAGGLILGGMTGDDAFAKPRRPDIAAGVARFRSALT